MDRVSASARGTIFPNVVLIGARASGKSRLARQLAEKVGWKRVSTDDRITARWGPIADLVARAGWDRFRELEAAVLAEISGRRLVVDCGGGIVERNENLRRLRALGTVYWVRAPAAVLRERLARPRQRITRPLFAGVSAANEAAAMLARRTPRYRDAATADVWNGEPRTAAPEDAANALFEAHFGPRLALSVAAPTVEAATAGLVQAAAELGPGDLIELRLDHLATPTPAAAAALLRPLSEALLRRLIVTVRPLSEGGRFPAGEEERSALLIESARLGPGWMDLEYEADRRSRGSLSPAHPGGGAGNPPPGVGPSPARLSGRPGSASPADGRHAAQPHQDRGGRFRTDPGPAGPRPDPERSCRRSGTHRDCPGSSRQGAPRDRRRGGRAGGQLRTALGPSRGRGGTADSHTTAVLPPPLGTEAAGSGPGLRRGRRSDRPQSQSADA